MMIFRVHLKKTKKPIQPRLRFDLEKLRNTDVAGTFQATTGGKFAPLINPRDDGMGIDSKITTNNTAVTETANKIVRRESCRKKFLVTSVMRGGI